MDSQLQQLIRENLYLRAVPCKIRPRTHTHTLGHTRAYVQQVTKVKGQPEGLLSDGKDQSNQRFLFPECE